MVANVEFWNVANAAIAPAVEAALKAANTPTELVPEGRKVFWDCMVQGYTLDKAIGAALSKRAPDGGSWQMGRWIFWNKLVGVDINADDASADTPEEHSVLEIVKQSANRAKRAAASKRTEKGPNPKKWWAVTSVTERINFVGF